MLLQKFNLGSDVSFDEVAGKCEGMRQVSILKVLNFVYLSFYVVQMFKVFSSLHKRVCFIYNELT